MSINDIINYVNKTPGNTNPAVIKTMVESETYGVLDKAKQMDEETLAMAKSYTNNKFATLEMTTSLPNSVDTPINLSEEECAVLNKVFNRLDSGEHVLLSVAWIKDNGYIGLTLAQFVVSTFCGFVFETMDAVAGEPGRYVLATDGEGVWGAVKFA